jgi:hypothetical protein
LSRGVVRDVVVGDVGGGGDHAGEQVGDAELLRADAVDRDSVPWRMW